MVKILTIGKKAAQALSSLLIAVVGVDVQAPISNPVTVTVTQS